MPQVIFRYNPSLFTGVPEAVSNLGRQIIPLVADAASTKQVPFTSKDIEWIPQAHEEGTWASLVAIEIRTIGFPKRKEKMNTEAMKALKAKILALSLLDRKAIDKDAPLIWVQFQDPDGCHV